MSFDLRIKFAGICLFVPQPAAGQEGARMHVLMPKVEHQHHGGHGGGVISEHLPRLLYDRAYEQPGSSNFTRELACVPLDRLALELGGLSSDGFTPALPAEVASLEEVAGRVPPARVSDHPGTEVAARVTLRQGRVTYYPAGLQAKLRAKEEFRRMTANVEWTIRGIPGEYLPRQVLKGLDGGPGATLPELYPMGDVIHLEVYNAPAGLLPGGKPKPGEASTDHFGGFYSIWGMASGPLPVLDGTQALVRNSCLEPVSIGSQGLPDGAKCIVSTARLAD